MRILITESQVKTIINELFDSSKPPNMKKIDHLNIFYHGTNNKFEINNIKLPAHFGTKKAAESIGGKFLLKAKLNLKNPIRLYDNEVQEWNTSTVRGTLLYEYGFTEEMIQKYENEYGEVNGLVKLLEDKGYDSIVYENNYEDIGNDSYIVFKKEQIISPNIIDTL